MKTNEITEFKYVKQISMLITDPVFTGLLSDMRVAKARLEAAVSVLRDKERAMLEKKREEEQLAIAERIRKEEEERQKLDTEEKEKLETEESESSDEEIVPDKAAEEVIVEPTIPDETPIIEKPECQAQPFMLTI